MADIKQINGALIGFLLGSAVGGAIALLYAPKPGKQLRDDIKRTTNELYEEGKKMTYESWNDAKEKAEGLIDSANEIISTNVDKLVKNTESVKESVKAGVNAYNQERKAQEKKSETNSTGHTTDGIPDITMK